MEGGNLLVSATREVDVYKFTQCAKQKWTSSVACCSDTVTGSHHLLFLFYYFINHFDVY